MKKKTEKIQHRIPPQLPQVAILLESTHEASRGRLRGIMQYIRLYGPWRLHIITGGTEEQRLPAIQHWKATGIIARIPNAKIGRAVLATGLPTVLFDPLSSFLEQKHPLSCCCRSSCDNHLVGQLAAKHFLEQGFEHYAIVPDRIATNWSQDRFDGFTDEIERAGKIVTYYNIDRNMNSDWGLELPRMVRWLHRLPKLAAIFAPHDLRGRQVLDACFVAKIKVPHHVAVIGVDNDEQVCESTTPNLSSVAIDTEAGGFAAAKMLDGLMRGILPEQKEVLYPPKGVVQRASTKLISFDDPIVLQAREFIQINSGFSIRVTDIAKYLKLSTRTIEMHFKKSLGYSVLEEIQKVRIEAVRRLIVDTTMPFGQIAALSGLESVGHLGEIFKKEFDMTMSEYRASKRNSNHPERIR